MNKMEISKDRLYYIKQEMMRQHHSCKGLLKIIRIGAATVAYVIIRIHGSSPQVTL